jgi:hypothetical protein
MQTIDDVSDWPTYGEEHTGSKRKGWLLDPRDPNKVPWLFKYPRPGTGEHWAEALAALVAHLLSIPHAEVRLARRGAELGSIAKDFRHGANHQAELVLGNTLLATAITTYDKSAPKPPSHTVDAVLEFLELRDIAPPLCQKPPHGVSLAPCYFVGYLLLDALVGNTDRHHENWGLVVRRWRPCAEAGQASSFSETWELAPTFDHASSLGRDLDDATRSRRLSGLDPRFTVEHYAARGRTPLFSAGHDSRQMTTREAFRRASELRPFAAQGWLNRLEEVGLEQLEAAVDTLPATVVSDPARAFAKAVLACNRRHLLSVPKQS